jgi:hypothetical protein
MHVEHAGWIWYLVRGDWYYGVDMLDYLSTSCIDAGVMLAYMFFGGTIQLPWRAHGRGAGRVAG